MSDLRENVRRAVAGDREAAAELLTPHLPALRAYLRLQASPLIRARESVADLMQSVCREILQDLAAFDATDESSLRRWLFVAAKRKLADRARRHGAEKRGGGAALVPLDSWSDADPIVCGIYARILGPMDHAIAAETQAKLEAALARLNEEERQIIWLARIEGLPRAEVAQAMGKTEGAARTALSRALARLAKLMDGD